ncbi:DUF945 family protein [Vibrio cholerae]|uniref:DUF945 family protein n=1 Tax=Vibrio TaxID=662 RepID=UPI0004E346D7|nr:MULTISPECIES: YdgA family protein [Vibrio]KFD79341.1 hypothetical protein DA89_3339 [Vibrio paracholerae]QAV05109.1 hypothetical protein FORC76_1612 [Vibrio cholerae]GHW89818.1 hypothetical protein VCSRO155_0267 [Vibrio cholerae]
MKSIKMIGAVGGAVALGLCWPLAVGQIGESAIKDGLNNFESPSTKAELVNYQRGYLSSQMQTRYKITDPTIVAQLEAEGIPTEILVDSTLTHGLMGVSAVSTLPQFPEFPLQILSNTKLNGNTDYTVKLEQWNYVFQGEEPVTVTIEPAQMSGSLTTLGEMTFQLNVPKIILDFENQAQIVLSQITGDGQGKESDGLWLGAQNFKLDKLSVDQEGQTEFDMGGFTYHFTSGLDTTQTRFTTAHKMKIADAKYSGGEFKEFALDFTLGDLDTTATKALSKLYQGAPEMTEQDVEQILPQVEALFSKGFFVSVDNFSANISGGDFASNWRLNVPEGTENLLQDPMAVIPTLTGQTKTYISNQLVTAFPFIAQGIEQLMMMEMMTQDDKGYTLQAEIKEGNVVFSNGKTMPLVMLLMPLMMLQG